MAIEEFSLFMLHIKADFHWEYFCSRMKKQKKKNSRKEKKVSFESASVKICKNQLTNQIEEKAEYFSTREQKNSQWKSALTL